MEGKQMESLGFLIICLNEKILTNFRGKKSRFLFFLNKKENLW